jgi:hypothetical protein
MRHADDVAWGCRLAHLRSVLRLQAPPAAAGPPHEGAAWTAACRTQKSGSRNGSNWRGLLRSFVMAEAEELRVSSNPRWAPVRRYIIQVRWCKMCSPTCTNGGTESLAASLLRLQLYSKQTVSQTHNKAVGTATHLHEWCHQAAGCELRLQQVTVDDGLAAADALVVGAQPCQQHPAQ